MEMIVTQHINIAISNMVSIIKKHTSIFKQFIIDDTQYKSWFIAFQFALSHGGQEVCQDFTVQEHW